MEKGLVRMVRLSDMGKRILMFFFDMIKVGVRYIKSVISVMMFKLGLVVIVKLMGEVSEKMRGKMRCCY